MNLGESRPVRQEDGVEVDTVLVVDDQPDFCRLVRDIFVQSGDCLDVAEAYDASSALRLIPEFMPDVVLIDVEMPGMDGLEATARIRDMFPAIRVVVMSIHDDEGFQQLAISAGAARFVSKAQLFAEGLQHVLA
jgi:two-component system response regulator DegU